MKSLGWAICLVFAASISLVAEERQFPAYNCAITPPDDWSEMPPRPGLLASYCNEDHSALLLVMVDEKNKPTGPLDDAFVSEFDKGMERGGGGKRLSGKFIEIAGIKTYERVGTISINGREASTLVHALPADGRFFNIEVMNFGGSAEEPVVRQALDSFRFLKPPVPPRDRSAAFRIGQIVGRSIVGFAVIGAIVGGLIGGLRALVGLKRKRATVPPPPLPPEG